MVPLRPMLAVLASAPLVDPDLFYEPKYDGVRTIAAVEWTKGKGPSARVRLWSRLANEKTAQFPEIADAVARWATRLRMPLVVDGEIVALDAEDRPTSFVHLQSRIHVGGRRGPSAKPRPGPPVRVAFVVFDLLFEGSKDLRANPLTERRARLETLFVKRPTADEALVRLSEIARGDGRALYARARRDGGEGLIAKQAASPYRSAKRTPEWRKLKLVREQEFVVGGWTEPRGTRSHLGALLLGVYPSGTRRQRGALDYVGSVGTGFDERKLTRVMEALAPLRTDTSPFRVPPDVERPHWVEPSLVAAVRFAEWTPDDKLRHPVYLGLRTDKRPGDVRREHNAPVDAHAAHRVDPEDTSLSLLVDRLRAIEDSRRAGVLELPGGDRLEVGNLHKVFWPGPKLTKGDLFRYYVQVAPALLPVLADRPLVMKRYPDGVAAKPFYQHHADRAPAGVRLVSSDAPDSPLQLVGGSLTTLLYTTQLAAISQDPWFSRVQSPGEADYAALDLDPSPSTRFADVLDVARWIRDELARLGAVGVPKTSGSRGLHIYLPLPRNTPYEAGLLFCQIVATLVVHKHRKHATTERSVRARGTRVYVDCLQNARGKTLASAYSARASDYAGVSTPLTWEEVDDGVEREDFTIRSMPDRLRAVGDLWAGLREAPGVDLARAAGVARRR